MFNSWFLALLLCFQIAQARDIPRPAFSVHREFITLPAQSAQQLKLNTPAEVFVFDEAAQVCGLSFQETQFELSRIFHWNESVVISTLKKFFGNIPESELNGLRITVDNFGQAANQYPSFYLKPQKDLPATISVDCSDRNRPSWPALMAHELTHHLNRRQNLSVWMDEMLAQLMEVQSSLAFPTPRIETLMNSPITPSFFTLDDVFYSSQQYASNLLFGLYLQQLMGFSVFQNLHSSIQTLDDLSAKLVAYAKPRRELDWLDGYLTPKSIIRHFHLALSLNAPILNGGSIFMIPRWPGFQKGTELAKGRVRLQPGSSVRLSSSLASKLPRFPDDIEAYRVLKTGMKFKILDLSEQPTEKWDVDYIVLINLSQDQIFDLIIPEK
jgi:hypothetical protein